MKITQMNHKAEAENQNQLKLCIFNEIKTDEGIKERDMTLESIREIAIRYMWMVEKQQQKCLH